MKLRKTRAGYRIPTHVAIGTGRRHSKGIRIEVPIRHSQNHRTSERWIPGWPNRVPRVAIVRRIKSKLGCKRKSRLHIFDRTYRPATQQLIPPSFNAGEERLGFPKRQFVACIYRGEMSNISGGRTPIEFGL